MEFPKVKDEFRKFLLENDFKIIRENKKSFIAYNKHVFREDQIRFQENDINDFGNFLDRVNEYTKFGEFGYCCLNNCEHKITSDGSNRNLHMPYKLRRFGEEIVFGKESDKNIYIKISSCSKTFIFYCLKNKIDTSSNFYYTLFRNREIEKVCNFDDFLSGILTIKIYNLPEKEIHSSIKKSFELITSCLFELSLLKDVNLKLDEPKSKERFRYRRETVEKDLKVPSIFYDEKIVKHYHMGLEEAHPILSYLSFYQVLEGYFIKATTKRIIQDIKKKLLNPRFNTYDDLDVSKLIDDILSFKSEENELQQ
jgi:hypothetical protein